jgi:hypothetical protein
MAVPIAVLLIDQNYIYQFTHLNKSVEWAYISPSILDAQATKLQPVIGTDLYKHILDGTRLNTLSGNYLILKDEYIKPVVLYWTMYDLLPHLKVKIDNGGIVERTSDTTTPAGQTDVNRIRDDYFEKAQFAMRRMVDFICHNQSSFPEYSTNDENQLYSAGKNRSVTFGVVSRTTNTTPLNENPLWRHLIG